MEDDYGVSEDVKKHGKYWTEKFILDNFRLAASQEQTSPDDGY
jgi:hypothetical protein